MAVSGGHPAPARGWPTGGGLVRRTALLAALVVGVVLAGTCPALAAPPPTDPGDGALDRSRAQVGARAAEVTSFIDVPL